MGSLRSLPLWELMFAAGSGAKTKLSAIHLHSTGTLFHTLSHTNTSIVTQRLCVSGLANFCDISDEGVVDIINHEVILWPWNRLSSELLFQTLKQIHMLAVYKITMVALSFLCLSRWGKRKSQLCVHILHVVNYAMAVSAWDHLNLQKFLG